MLWNGVADVSYIVLVLLSFVFMGEYLQNRIPRKLEFETNFRSHVYWF